MVLAIRGHEPRRMRHRPCHILTICMLMDQLLPLIAQTVVVITTATATVVCIIVRAMLCLLHRIVLWSQVLLWVLEEMTLSLLLMMIVMMCTCAGSVAERRGDASVVRGWCASPINSISIFIVFGFIATYNDLGRGRFLPAAAVLHFSLKGVQR